MMIIFTYIRPHFYLFAMKLWLNPLLMYSWIHLSLLWITISSRPSIHNNNKMHTHSSSLLSICNETIIEFIFNTLLHTSITNLHHHLIVSIHNNFHQSAIKFSLDPSLAWSCIHLSLLYITTYLHLFIYHNACFNTHPSSLLSVCNKTILASIFNACLNPSVTTSRHHIVASI